MSEKTTMLDPDSGKTVEALVGRRKPVIAVDLDGTLLHYDGWKGESHLGAPNPGMPELLRALRDRGWIIVLWTTRGQRGLVQNHMLKHGVVYDYINENPLGPPGSSPKIFADVYLDDRAVRFVGETEGLLETVVSAVPWFESKD